MPRLLPLRNALGALAVVLLLGTSAFARPAPEFHHTEPEHWLGSEPLTMADLRGEVVLVHFWTYICYNCYRSFPWLNQLEASLAGEKFRVIGIHTPEYSSGGEYDPARVREKMAGFKLAHAVMMDNQRIQWSKYHNRYWPAYYLIDHRGIIRNLFIGETHAGDTRAKRIESEIRRLLAKV